MLLENTSTAFLEYAFPLLYLSFLTIVNTCRCGNVKGLTHAGFCVGHLYVFFIYAVCFDFKSLQL
jgi:hypothetical protein